METQEVAQEGVERDVLPAGSIGRAYVRNASTTPFVTVDLPDEELGYSPASSLPGVPSRS